MERLGGEEELDYDQDLKPPTNGGGASPFSRWGPNRPQHTIEPPQSKKTSCRYVQHAMQCWVVIDSNKGSCIIIRRGQVYSDVQQ